MNVRNKYAECERNRYNSVYKRLRQLRSDNLTFLANSLNGDYQYEDLLLRHLGSGDSFVLNLGCGVKNFSNSRLKYVPLDFSHEALIFRRENFVGEADHSICSDVHCLPFRSGTVDGICMSGVLPYLDLERALSEFNRILKIEGKIVLMDVYSRNPVVLFFRYIFRLIGRRTYILRNLRKIDQNSTYLKKGFIVLADVKVGHLVPFFFPKFIKTSVIFNKLAIRLSETDNVIFNLLSIKRIVVLRKEADET